MKLKISDFEEYHKKGGEYVMPVEVFNDLFDEYEKQYSTVKLYLGTLSINNKLQHKINDIESLLYIWKDSLDLSFQKEIFKIIKE